VAIIYQLKPQFPGLQGIDTHRVGNVIPIDRYITGGSLAALDDDSIILGSQLAVALGARMGDRVEVYSPLAFEKLKLDEMLLPRELRVVGFSSLATRRWTARWRSCPCAQCRIFTGLAARCTASM
jgi:lipoprotein-releasing system permease protein